MPCPLDAVVRTSLLVDSKNWGDGREWGRLGMRRAGELQNRHKKWQETYSLCWPGKFDMVFLKTEKKLLDRIWLRGS